MAFIPVPNTARVELVYTLAGIYAENVLHFKFATSPSPNQMTQLAVDLKAWWIANLKPLMSTATILDKILVANLDSVNAQAIEYAVSEAGSITDATGQLLPQNVTVAVKHVTGFRGRSYRGRTYHPGLCENQTNASTLVSTFRTSLIAAYTALIGYTWTDTGWNWVVASKYSNNAPRTVGVTTPITAVTVDVVTDSQRRRLPGRGQ